MSKKEVDVIFLFEKQGRELDVLCLLKVLLEQKKLTVKIIQQNTQVYFALKNFNPKVVILPFCYQNRSNNTYFCFWRAAKYISLNWEQFFYPGNKIAKSPRGMFATQRVIHCAWSEEYVNLLKDCGVPQSNICLIGSLPLSLLNEKYNSYFQNKNSLARKYNINEKSKWIFFPENFGWAFYKDNMLNQMINDGQKAEDVYAMRKFSDDSFREIINWCIRLVEEHDLIVILRPRPATSVEEIKSRIENYFGKLPQRLKVIKDLSVKDWILSADYVISSYSTSLIEAAVAGKNIVMMTPYAIPKVLKQVWYPYVNKCNTYEEFVVSILAKDKDNSEKLRSWAKSNLYLGLEPPEAITEIIAKCCRDSQDKKTKISVSELIIGDYSLMSYIRFWIRNLITLMMVQVNYGRKPHYGTEYYEDYSALEFIDEKTFKFQKYMK